MKNSQYRWQFWIDRGGTFTDVIGRRSDGQIIVHKLLSDNSAHYSDAAIQGIRDVLQLSDRESIPLNRLSVIKMGTTVATNALLERNGEPTVLFVNEGFSDALRIGYQSRPDIFAKHIVLPQLLYEKVIELPGRISAYGKVLTPFDHVRATQSLKSAYEAGFRSCAIVFMHGYKYPEHERDCMALAKQAGFEQISVSHEVSPLIKFVTRGDTTVADAYLSPILNRYLKQLKRNLGETPIFFMQSNGGLVGKSLFRGKDSLLSGPAGGVIGAVKVSGMAGIDKLIGFDMGGTSTDVFHYEGDYERQMESQISGINIRVPMMSITTVASGGGSIISIKNGRFLVGPESAGATPGPACYKNNGPLTITDCNVLLGRIQADYFPALFGVGGDEALDYDVVLSKFETLRLALANDLSKTDSALAAKYTNCETIAEGFLQVVVQKMAQAIKKVSIEKGHDITAHALVSFGGAGGQHACLVAECLGISTVLIHPMAGVLSALGIGLAKTSTIKQLSVQAKLELALQEKLDQLVVSLSGACKEDLRLQGAEVGCVSVSPKLLVHYDGSDSTLLVDHSEIVHVRDSFEAAHRKRYGFFIPDKDLIVEALLVEVSDEVEEANITSNLQDFKQSLSNKKGHIPKSVSAPSPSIDDRGQSNNRKLVRLYSKENWYDVPVYSKNTAAVGSRIIGPAIMSDNISTTIVEAGWSANFLANGELLLRRDSSAETYSVSNTKTSSDFLVSNRSSSELKTPLHADPVLLELFNNMFMSIAEEMGTTLQQTSHSVNIKERLDFSCAIFDAEGNLIANAPHIPVHLGSMGESVQVIINSRKESMHPGDVFILNDPYHGGTHLPDITVITPIFDQDSMEIIFYTASRGHHSDIGGTTPGSMPPDSVQIDQEGVLIDNFQLVKNDRFLESEIRSLLGSGLYPSRNIERNISDLKAQMAANNRGASGLAELLCTYGKSVVLAYMRFIRLNAEESVRCAIAKLKGGRFIYPMDDGSQIAVLIKIDRESRSATIDFEGTSAQLSTNFNAPISVCKAAVLYVFRTLIEENIPLNGGCMAPLTVKIPRGSMLNPRYPAAVVAGNVETSQCIVDALYGALNVMSASQGTMNNFTFGNDCYQYYETIAGGSGAGPSFNGTDAVQTHMTNSRLTDPEVLEWRFPVTVQSFSIRPDSGGIGKFSGGQGVIRRIKFNESMTASILSGRRIIPPFGLNGGGPGSTGNNYIEKADGSVLSVSGTESVKVDAGDIFTIETPGGGSWGAIDL